jgi:hypothetical protein
MLADPEQTIYLADMSGDGLSDLVRVRNGEVRSAGAVLRTTRHAGIVRHDI